MFNTRREPNAEAADLMYDLANLTAYSFGSRASDWAAKLTPEQVAAIRESIVDIREYSESEIQLFQYILRPLRFDEAPLEGFYESLVLHRAFMGRAVREQIQYRFDLFTAFVLGLRDPFRNQVDFSTPQKKAESVALVSFLWETHVYDLPSTRISKHPLRRYQYAKYADAELRNLVLEHAGDVDRLTGYAIDRKTLNVEFLRSMLSEDQPTALTEGML